MILAAGCAPTGQNADMTSGNRPAVVETNPPSGQGGAQGNAPGSTEMPAAKPLTEFVALTYPTKAVAGATCRQAYENLYARIEVVPLGLHYTDGAAVPDNKWWDAFKRLFMRSKTTSFVLTLKVYESHFLPEISHKLLALTTDDTDKNQVKKDVIDRRVISPYFLVDDSFTFHLSAEPQSQTMLDPHALRLITNVLQTAAPLLAPGSSLATTVTKPSFEAEARNFDSAIGRAFSSDRQESVNTDAIIQAPARISTTPVGGEAGTVAEITLYPDEKESARAAMATWSVRMSKPRPTIFVDSVFDHSSGNTQCFELTNDARSAIRAAQLTSAKKAFENISPDDILSFRISKEQTLRQNIATRNWYGDALINTGKATLLAAAEWRAGVGNLCKAAREAYDSFGFNSFDTTALLWATIRDLPTRPAGNWLASASTPAACSTMFARMTALGLPAN
jgi:hypothetical protein